MDYRDDRDALKARMESLEGELATARAEAERMRATENALAAAQRENEKLRAEVRRLTPTAKPPISSSKTAFLVGGGIAVLTVGAAVFVTFASSGPEPAPVTFIEVPATAKPVAEGPTPAAPPEESARATTVEWPARVKKAEGLSYPVGSACTVRATLRTDGRQASMPDVEIACAGKWLYRSTDQLAGMSNSTFEVEEVPGAEEGSHRAVLSYQDTGSRTGERTQASISTFDHVAVAWTETAPTYRVELEVDEMSSAWKGPALFTEHEGRKPELRAFLQRTARVVEVQDAPLVTKGDVCSVEARPSWVKDTTCRVRVHCGATTLYGTGSSGYNKCAAEGSSLLRASDGRTSDADSDPSLDLDVIKGLVEVADTTPTRWSVKLRLDPAGR